MSRVKCKHKSTVYRVEIKGPVKVTTVECALCHYGLSRTVVKTYAEEIDPEDHRFFE